MRALRGILILTKKERRNKIQSAQNKCVQFCLDLDKMPHISQNEFEKLNWFPISDRINQSVLSTTFKFVNDIGPKNLNEVFQWAAESRRTLRNDYRKLKHPFRKTTAGQNSLSFLVFQNGTNCQSLQKSVMALTLSNIILKNFIWHNLLIK